MNNNIFNRGSLILILLLFTFNNALLAKEYTNEVKTQKRIIQNQKPSLIFLKNYYKYDLAKNHLLASCEFYSSDEEENYSKKSPWLALFLSSVFPAAGGQFYNGEYLKALLIDAFIVLGSGLFMLGAMSVNYDSESFPDYVGVLLYSGVGLSGGAYLYSIIDAPISANKINERKKQSSKINVISSNNGKYLMNIGYSKFYKSYSFGIRFNF